MKFPTVPPFGPQPIAILWGVRAGRNGTKTTLMWKAGLFWDFRAWRRNHVSNQWLTYCGWKKSGYPDEVGSFPCYLQGFIHPRWCRISSINLFLWSMCISACLYTVMFSNVFCLTQLNVAELLAWLFFYYRTVCSISMNLYDISLYIIHIL